MITRETSPFYVWGGALLFLIVIAGIGLIVYSRLFTLVLNRPEAADDSINLSQTEFYVAPSGDDNNLGTLEAPFQTIERARNRIRQASATISGDITVYLRAGTYELSGPLVFEQSDSGRNEFKVIYRNFPNEQPVISGGRTIGGWTQEGGLWKASVGALNTRQLYVNGVRAVRARSTGPLTGMQKTTDGFSTTDTSILGWNNISDVEFVARRLWRASRCSFASVAPGSGGALITIDDPCWSNTKLVQDPFQQINTPTWIENAKELLDAPGEWYLDQSTGTLYYKPRTGENMTTAQIVAPLLETLIQGSGTIANPIHDIRFEGLRFSYATWIRPSSEAGFPEVQATILYNNSTDSASYLKNPGNISFENAKRIVFENNIFTHLGAAGLDFGHGSQDNIINRNEFFDISGSALQVGNIDQPSPTDSRMIVRGNIITNNTIHDIGVEYEGGVGIFVGYAQNTRIAHNDLHSLPYTAISIGFGWGCKDPSAARDNRIEANKISDHMKVLIDGGGIYTLGAQPGSVIAQNVIQNQRNEIGALYLDQGSRFFEVRENVIFGNVRTALIRKGDQNIHDNWWQNRGIVGAPDFGSYPDIWYAEPEPCTAVAPGSDTISGNRVITSLNQAPSVILQQAGPQPPSFTPVPSPSPTPAPTPSPSPTPLTCLPRFQIVRVGQDAHLVASGGSGQGSYLWLTPRNVMGQSTTGDVVTVRYASQIPNSRRVTVTRGSQQRHCVVYLVP